jgi:Mycothiol maleylpyruvate isomerase N-terminal domain
MMDEAGRTALIERISATRQRWRRLVADVGEDRLEEPGAMGDWTFKDVAAHLTAWRRQTVDRLAAAARGEPEPLAAWPESLGEDEDDPINAWIHEQTKNRPPSELLAEADAIYADFVAAIRALPIEVVTHPGRFAWLEGQALAEVDPGGHLAGHEADVRRWLTGG